MINIDAAGEWADETAGRWLTTDPMDGLSTASRPEEIRTGVVKTIAETARTMAKKTRAAGCYPHATPAGCKTWLETCCNQLAEPDLDTKPERTMPRFGTGATARAEAAPLLRWAAGSREQAQKSGLRWTRGRNEGPLELDVMEVDAVQTIIEHGWPADENELVAKIATAIATATRRTAEAQKTPAASIAELANALMDDARRYAATRAAQRPDWVNRPGP